MKLIDRFINDNLILLIVKHISANVLKESNTNYGDENEDVSHFDLFMF
jgi:hypothetical protein